MKRFLSLLFAGVSLGASTLYAQAIQLTTTNVQAVGSSVTAEKLAGKETIRVVKDPAIQADDEPTYARLKDVQFRDGTIEVKVFSRLRSDAPEHARGFIGVAFRINEDNSKFECIYIRPQNAMVEDQLRRNRSTQYFSYPDFKFDRLRKEAAGQYESYAEMALNTWIDVRIEVKDAQAKLFINGQKQPVLIVNDLKHGPEAAGAVGLFVDIGTEGYFSDLTITKN
jgi:hypothetical protein